MGGAAARIASVSDGCDSTYWVPRYRSPTATVPRRNLPYPPSTAPAMHQQSRHPPRVSSTSPATSPQTNPTRTNNPREGVAAAAGRARAGSEAVTPLEAPSPPEGQEPAVAPGPSRESIKKLDQIIQVCTLVRASSVGCRADCQQNFYLKAAVLILQSRIAVTPTAAGKGRKTNKWVCIIPGGPWGSGAGLGLIVTPCPVPNRDR